MNVITAHWLAIEGVQPAIVQNPLQTGKEGEKERDRDRDKTDVIVDVPSSAVEGEDNVQVKVGSFIQLGLA